MKKIDTSRIMYYLLAALMAGIFLFFSYARVFDEFEYSTYDFRYRLRPPHKAPDEIVIVEVGDDSIEKLGKWPFPREYHALMVNALKAAGVKTIVFDIFFSEEKEGDETFAEAVEQAGNVYIPYVFELDRDETRSDLVRATGYAAPLIDVLDNAALGTGFVNVEPDMDGKIRRVPPFIQYDGKKYPHLTVLVALNELGYDFEDIKVKPARYMAVDDDLVIPLGKRSSMLVNYPSKWGKAFRHYSYVDILQSYLSDVTGQEPVIDLAELKDTVCFIGLTATASPDAHPSPMEPLYPGIGVHTSIYNSIMGRDFLRRLGKWWNMLILVAMWVFTAYVTQKSRKRFALFSILLIVTGYLAVALFFFWPLGIWIDVFYPVVTMSAIYIIFTFKKYVTEIQKREVIEKELDIAKGIQQSFLPPSIPEAGGLRAGVKMLTARQVGGDLYDAISLGEGKLGLMLGDVSGKGVPAALYMGKVVSVFKTFVKDGTPGEVLMKVNDRLVMESASNLFVTLTFMVFDTTKDVVSFAMGGHMPTVFVDPSGNVEMLDVEEGMPMGLMESGFSEVSKKYEKGSVFILYSDGVTEAMNTREEMFGQDRLVELAKRTRTLSPEEIVEAIHQAVADFAGKAKQHDDITVMVIKT